jgi:predicted membrane protein
VVFSKERQNERSSSGFMVCMGSVCYGYGLWLVSDRLVLLLMLCVVNLAFPHFRYKSSSFVLFVISRVFFFPGFLLTVFLLESGTTGGLLTLVGQPNKACRLALPKSCTVAHRSE